MRSALLVVAIAIAAVLGLRLGMARPPVAQPTPAPAGHHHAGSAPAPSLPDEPAAAPNQAGDVPTLAEATRPAGEWQGMRVDPENQALCDAPDSCGLAMACLGGQCGPCQADAECAAGESCALEHCVPAPQVACRGRADCGADELCVLTGYSPDPRGNAAMAARCLPASGGTEIPDEPLVAGDPAAPVPVPAQALLDEVEADLRR